jgi:hypothetical protein
MGGRPGHEGYFRIPGQPLAGKPVNLRVNLSGQTKSTEFSFVSEAGEVIKPFPMHLEDHSGDDQEFFGEVELPSQPFRIAVRGIDSKGGRFQRYNSPLFRAQTVSMAEIGGTPELFPGKTASLKFVVRNTGAPATFRIVVWDSRQLTSRIDPKELTLLTGASGTVTVDLTVPAATAAGTSVTFVITATNTTSPEIYNSVVKEFSVSAAGNSSAPQ